MGLSDHEKVDLVHSRVRKELDRRVANKLGKKAKIDNFRIRKTSRPPTMIYMKMNMKAELIPSQIATIWEISILITILVCRYYYLLERISIQTKSSTGSLKTTTIEWDNYIQTPFWTQECTMWNFQTVLRNNLQRISSRKMCFSNVTPMETNTS